MTQQQTEEKQMETQEEEQEDALESLLSKVSLADPLEIPLDSGKMLMIDREQFRYYLPKDATEEEQEKQRIAIVDLISGDTQLRSKRELIEKFILNGVVPKFFFALRA